MNRFASDIAFTPAVKAVQAEKGSRTAYSKVEDGRGWQTSVTPELTAFLAGLDMFYLGTANAEGQPYIQYRGGAPGFLKVIDESTLGFADFGGNRQYITLGNLDDNSKAFIFLMDYANSRRIKLWGTARVVEDDPDLLERIQDAKYPGRVERAILFTIEAWDVNCPQHIHKRFPQAVVAPVIEKLQGQIQELQAKLAEYEQGEKSTTNPILTGNRSHPETGNRLRIPGSGVHKSGKRDRQTEKPRMTRISEADPMASARFHP